MLGTPATDKKTVAYRSGHLVPRVEFMKETLAWLDEYKSFAEDAAQVERHEKSGSRPSNGRSSRRIDEGDHFSGAASHRARAVGRFRTGSGAPGPRRI
jgi:hypothetical protein